MRWATSRPPGRPGSARRAASKSRGATKWSPRRAHGHGASLPVQAVSRSRAPGDRGDAVEQGQDLAVRGGHAVHDAGGERQRVGPRRVGGSGMATTVMPAAWAARMAAWSPSTPTQSAPSTPRPAGGLEVDVWAGLAAGDLGTGHRRPEQRGEPVALEHRVDDPARRRGREAHGDPGGDVPDHRDRAVVGLHPPGVQGVDHVVDDGPLGGGRPRPRSGRPGTPTTRWRSCPGCGRCPPRSRSPSTGPRSGSRTPPRGARSRAAPRRGRTPRRRAGEQSIDLLPATMGN